ncbi:NAD(P)-dependent oxidoreductase [Thaumasiovibrio subtropicus]|uniref:NAD(P)-dependent oxidoreductase n=1 Tax=Thaumasiovibrio subtropicus TaxID=1891207 RepID=UPI000B35A1F4|nr:NAD(P)-dependent oxidoreductase [Thaumasiovibrio subtropicus]
MMSLNVAFIGLGTMGYPMAGHLAKHGYNVTVYNRTTSKAEKWVEEYAGSFATTPGEAAENADIVFTCVGNDNDVHEVYCDEQGIFSHVRENTLLVDHTTASPDIARRLNALAIEHGCRFIDAPVSGGEAGAVNGVLTVMAGGALEDFERAKPVMSAFAKSSALMGDSGAGQVTKMANQVCIAGILQGLSEAVTLAQASGLDIEKMVDVLKHGAAGSWQMENRAATMAADKFDFGFAIDWMRKDLAICFEQADKLNVELPLSKQVDAEYAKLQIAGENRSDTSVLIKQFKREAE